MRIQEPGEPDKGEGTSGAAHEGDHALVSHGLREPALAEPARRVIENGKSRGHSTLSHSHSRPPRLFRAERSSGPIQSMWCFSYTWGGDQRDERFSQWIDPQIEVLEGRRADQDEVGGAPIENDSRGDLRVNEDFG